jgi:hypothetical protein
VSMFDLIGVLPDDIKAVGDYLKKYYVENPAETARMCHARLLDDFYEGKGDEEMDRVIGLLWTDPRNAARRRAVLQAGLDKYDNVLARIAREKATVYAEPARRSVGNDTNDKFQSLVKRLNPDAVMTELDIKLAVHEDALLWYRVREKPTGEREPVIDVVSPASFWAIHHPYDRTLLVGIILDQRMPMASDASPAFRVWTDDQTFVMNGKCEIFQGSIEAWPLGRMPGVLCSMRRPGSKPTLLSACPSTDLLSAQKAVRLQDLNLAKESISKNKQSIAQGDLSSATMGQTSDSDGFINVPDGVSVTSLDQGVDTQVYHDAAERAADSAGANHGVPPSLRSQQDASSGAEIEMRRLPIREIRKKRIPVFRAIEGEFWPIVAMVNSQRQAVNANGAPVQVAGDLPNFAFDATGFGIDFGEVDQILTEQERDVVFETRRRLGLTNTLEEIRKRNPDIQDDTEAMKVLLTNVDVETQRVVAMKDLLAISGSMGASTDQVAGTPTPFNANRGNDGGSAPPP